MQKQSIFKKIIFNSQKSIKLVSMDLFFCFELSPRIQCLYIITTQDISAKSVGSVWPTGITRV